MTDIYAADRAKIAATNWERVHVEGDRRRPIDLPIHRRANALLGNGMRVERGGSNG